MQAVERKFAVNGYHLAAREWHAGATHRVIACHGWLDNAASFDVLIRATHPTCSCGASSLLVHTDMLITISVSVTFIAILVLLGFVFCVVPSVFH